MLGIEMLTDGLYRHFLIVSVCNTIFNTEISNVVPFPSLYEQIQIAFRVESLKPAWGIAQTIYYIGLKAVGVIDNRLNTISLFKALSV